MTSYSPRASAIAYARGLTAPKLLAKLAADDVDHPARIAQYLGQSGRGTPRTVADRITRYLDTLNILADRNLPCAGL